MSVRKRGASSELSLLTLGARSRKQPGSVERSGEKLEGDVALLVGDMGDMMGARERKVLRGGMNLLEDIVVFGEGRGCCGGTEVDLTAVRKTQRVRQRRQQRRRMVALLFLWSQEKGDGRRTVT